MHASERSQPIRLLREAEEVAYQTCLQSGPLTEDELGRQLGRTPAECRQLVETLTELGLLTEVEGRLDALPPRAALQGLAEQLEAAAEHTRRSASTWGELWQQNRKNPSFIEVLTDDDATSAVKDLVVGRARNQVRGLQIGPVGPLAMRPKPEVANGFFDAIGRGVRFRVVYGVRVLSDSLALSAVQECIAAGEEARVFPDVPMSLTIGDDLVAVITVAGDTRNRRNAVVVHPSGLLDSLVQQFESYWRMAVPISVDAESAREDEPPNEELRQMLAYLTAGLTDESIARELGVSERTVGRRVARLQELLGAQSRFQLGSQATRRGWI